MTPGEWQATTERARGAIAWARELAVRSAEARATAAEFTVIAQDLRSRTQAERKRPQLLARERRLRDGTGLVAVHLEAGGTPQVLNHLSPRQTQTGAAIRRQSQNRVSAAAPAIHGAPPVRRHV
jgi:hypothetical protein